jgi:lambda family phage portal protein
LFGNILKRFGYVNKRELMSYVGSSFNRYATKKWAVSSGDSDVEDLPYLNTLRDRSRDQYRNNGLITGALNTKAVSVVGNGLRVQPQVDYEYLGLTSDEATEWEKKAEREFNFVAESVYSDSSETQTFYEMQLTAFLSMMISGDCFVLMPRIERADTPYMTSLQLIEADRISNPEYGIDTFELAGGIKVDKYGKPLSYFVASHHEDSIDYSHAEWIEIEARSELTNQRNILHLFDKTRPHQRRGVPILAPVLEKLKQLDEYTTAELTSAIINGLLTVFFKSDKEAPDGLDEPIELMNGGIIKLYQGESIDVVNPKSPNSTYDDFTTSIMKQIAIGLNMPYELFIKHFQSSYTSARASFLEAWRIYKRERGLLARQFCQPFYEAIIYEAVLNGRLEAEGFLTDSFIRRAYLKSVWKGGNMGQINEKVETEASRMRVENGFSTAETEAFNINGSDYYSNMRRKKEEANVMINNTPKELRGDKRWVNQKEKTSQ